MLNRKKVQPNIQALTMSRVVSLTLFALASLTSGCAKNVDKIDFTKWGNSFVTTQRTTTGMDLTAQGGAAQNGAIPQNTTHKVTKASLGGPYQRNFATSTHYRMVGGFHVTGSQ